MTKKNYKCASGFAWRVLDNKVVILDTGSGDYYMLNETASLIWEGVIAQQDSRKIVRKLIQEYQISEEKVLQDINRIINSLEAEGKLVLCNATDNG